MIPVTIDTSIRIRIDALSDDQFRLVLEGLRLPNPEYLRANKRGRSTRHIEEYLEFHRIDGNDIVIPRGFGADLQDMLAGVTWDDRRLLLPEVPFTFLGQLRGYQVQAAQEILRRPQGVLQAGTGSGKTVTALAVITERKQPTLILVHTQELMLQWRDRIRQFLGIEAGQIGGGKFDIQPITVGTVQSASKHLEELSNCFGFIIIDECHRTPASTFSVCADAFPAKYRLGLSATPFRTDGLGRAIHFYLGPLVHEVDPDHLRKIGAILRPEIITRQTVFTFDRDPSHYYQQMLSELTQDPIRNQLIASDVVKELGRNAGIPLVVSDRVGHLETLRSCLKDRGVVMELLTGKTPRKQREAIVERIRAGQVQVLGSTLSLIAEGFDAPGLSALFLCSPIKSRGRLIQVIGRVLRPQAGKVPRVYDYNDVLVSVLKVSALARSREYRRIAA